MGEQGQGGKERRTGKNELHRRGDDSIGECSKSKFASKFIYNGMDSAGSSLESTLDIEDKQLRKFRKEVSVLQNFAI